MVSDKRHKFSVHHPFLLKSLPNFDINSPLTTSQITGIMKQISLLEHPQTFVRSTVLALSGSLLLAVSAQIEIPLWPVPITGQTFALYIIAAMFGARLGFYTVLLYLLEGSTGLPVFSGGSFGIVTLFGPTGGYLAGMLIAVYLMGRYFEQSSRHSFKKTIMILTLGTIEIGRASCRERV